MQFYINIRMDKHKYKFEYKLKFKKNIKIKCKILLHMKYLCVVIKCHYITAMENCNDNSAMIKLQ